MGVTQNEHSEKRNWSILWNTTFLKNLFQSMFGPLRFTLQYLLFNSAINQKVVLSKNTPRNSISAFYLNNFITSTLILFYQTEVI